MAKKEIAVKKHVVKLSAEERGRLEAMVRAGKNSAQILTRARILLKADVSDAGEGWSDSAIATALDTSINNVARTRQQRVEEGFEATLTRKYNPSSARPRIFDGAAEAKLIALTCSPAPEGFARRSLRLLEEKVVELSIVDKVSDNAIGRTLKKCAQTAPQSAMGDPARRQSGLCRRHGRRAGNPRVAARGPRDPDRPLVYVDETSKQLIAETRAPIPAKPGQPARHDYEYEREPRRQSLHDLRAAQGVAARRSDRPPRRSRLRESPQRLIRCACNRADSGAVGQLGAGLTRVARLGMSGPGMPRRAPR